MTSLGHLVDEGMRPLLEALWTLGLDTSFSCQGNRADWDHPLGCPWVGRHTNAHVVFLRFSDAVEFLRGSEPVLTRPVESSRRAVAAFGFRPVNGRPPSRALSAAVDFPSDVLAEVTDLWVTHAANRGGDVTPSRAS